MITDPTGHNVSPEQFMDPPAPSAIVEGPHKLSMPAHQFGDFVMEMLRDPNIPADKMQIMLTMWRESFSAQAQEAYQAAFIAFSAEMPAVERDGTVKLGDGKSYPFTTYEQMDKILRPLLSKNGLALQFWASPSELKDTVMVHGSLFGHGWHKESSYPVPPDTGPGRNAMQARGSAQSYAKRYNADLLCNIVRKGKDDDARRAIQEPIDATQLARLVELIDQTKTDYKQFLQIMVTGAEELEDVRQRDYPRLLLALQEKARRKRK